MDRLKQWLFNFGLNYKKPEHFTKPQWPRIPVWLYCVYRILIALYFVIWILLSGLWKYDWYIGEDNRIKWFIYLTNWSYLVLTLSVLWQAGLVLKSEYFNRGQGTDSLETGRRMRWYHKVCWVLYNVSTNTGLAVTVLYWSSETHKVESTHPVDINTHLINSVYIMFDFCVTAVPLRCQHFFHGAVMYLLYSAFNATYILRGRTNALGKNYIYSSEDWLNDPHHALVASVTQLAVYIGLWLALCVLYQLRVAIWRRIYATRTHQSIDEKSGLLANQSAAEK